MNKRVPIKRRPHYRPHEATFRGIHNSAKSKTLILLYHRKHTLRLNSGIDARQIHLESGVNYGTLLSSLGNWCKWGYVKRRGSISGDGLRYLYYIGQRGERFVRDRIPRDVLNRYVREIREFRAK